MENDCFEISFKGGCDKPVHIENDYRYIFDMESWLFYPTSKKIISDCHYSYASKRDSDIFRYNVSIIINDISKKRKYKDVSCILFNNNELTSDIIEQLRTFENNIDFVYFSDIISSIDIISNRTIIFINTEYRFNFLLPSDIEKISKIKGKDFFSIFVVNTGRDIDEIICHNDIFDGQPDNEIWYKTIDNKPVTLCLDEYNDGKNCIVLNEYNGDRGIIKYERNIEKIDDNLFCGNYNLMNVCLPKTIKEIGNGAFEKCISLKNINLHDNIEKIGYLAFYDAGLNNELGLPKNLIFLGDGAFRTESKQTELLIYNNIKDIDDDIGMSYSSSEYTVIYLETGVPEDMLKKIKMSFPSYNIVFFDKTYSITKIIKNDIWMK